MSLKINDLNQIETDFKAEAIAYNLWKYHKEIDMIFLKRLGGNNRTFLKDIKEIKKEFIDYDETILSIETFREGLYDYIPEGITHPLSLRKSSLGVEGIIEEIRKQKRNESNGRKFFLPFEQEFFYSQINCLSLEDSIDRVSSTDTFIDILSDLWPLLKDLDHDNALVFSHLLPFFYLARGKSDWIEKTLSSLLNVNVNISYIPNQIEEVDKASINLYLSNMTLGVSSVLTGKHFDGERNWSITYGPIEYGDLDQYMESTKLRQLLQKLYSFSIPYTINVKEIFITNRSSYSFQLNKENSCLLGYSTYL
jgi:hypothetical protein